MDQRWTLHVENFARLKAADVRIAPLICFIGDNNSGKSYVMTLLWGLLACGEIIFERQFDDTPAARRCNDWLNDRIGNEISVDEEAQRMYLDWFNEMLDTQKDVLVESIFNYKMSIDKIEIRDLKRSNDLIVKCEYDSRDRFNLSIQSGRLLANLRRLSMWPPQNDEYAEKRRKQDLFEINSVICWNMLTAGFTAPNPPGDVDELPVYFPVSRTGFLLTYRDIAGNAISQRFSSRLTYQSKSLKENLTRPNIHFLQTLIGIETIKRSAKPQGILKFIRDNMSNGDIMLDEEGRVIHYKPDDMNEELPMSVTSSVITELVPLILILQTHHAHKLFMIEEPEAHLHPALQKKMAQLIIRLVHSGTPVWITTHSDTILQHFNNMLNLKRNPKREEIMKNYTYKSVDLLDENEIALYQFTRGESETTIENSSLKKYGFITYSFNNAIQQLVQESYDFQEDE